MHPRSILMALLLMPAVGMAGCPGAAKLAEFSRISPLKAAEPDSEEIVSLHQDGCVSVRFPRHDRRHGEVSALLSKDRFDQLRAEIDASGVDRLQPERITKSLAEQQDGETLWMVSDDDIVEFRWFGKDQAKSTTWRSLNSDLLKNPDSAELAQVKALQQVFLELADDVHRAALENRGAAQ